MVASLDSTVTYVHGCVDKEDFGLVEGLEEAKRDHDEVTRLSVSSAVRSSAGSLPPQVCQSACPVQEVGSA